MFVAYGDLVTPNMWWWSCYSLFCYWTHHHDDLLKSPQGDGFYLIIQNELKPAWTPERHPATGHTATSDPRLDNTAPSAGFSKSSSAAAAAPHSGVCVTFCMFVHEFRTGCRLGDLWFDFWSRQDIFLFSKASRPALWFTQPHIQCALGAVCPGYRRLAREADRSEWVDPVPLLLLYAFMTYRASFTSVLEMVVAVDGEDSKDSLGVWGIL